MSIRSAERDRDEVLAQLGILRDCSVCNRSTLRLGKPLYPVICLDCRKKEKEKKKKEYEIRFRKELDVNDKVKDSIFSIQKGLWIIKDLLSITVEFETRLAEFGVSLSMPGGENE